MRNSAHCVCICVNAKCTILLARKIRTTDNKGEMADFELENPNRELPPLVNRRVEFDVLLDMA